MAKVSTKWTIILYVFFDTDTANVVQMAYRIELRARLIVTRHGNRQPCVILVGVRENYILVIENKKINEEKANTICMSILLSGDIPW